MSRRLRAALSIAFLLAAFEGTARADGGPSRVALVRSSSSDRVLREATVRVRAELLAAGFEVVEVDRPPGDPRSEVEDAAPQVSTFATVAMSRAPNGAFARGADGQLLSRGRSLVRARHARGAAARPRAAGVVGHRVDPPGARHPCGGLGLRAATPRGQRLDRGGRLRLHSEGSAATPYRGVGGDVASFLWTAGVGGLARIGPRVALAAEVAAVLLDPQPVVVIASRDAGRAGAPSIGASLALLVGL